MGFARPQWFSVTPMGWVPFGTERGFDSHGGYEVQMASIAVPNTTQGVYMTTVLEFLDTLTTNVGTVIAAIFDNAGAFLATLGEVFEGSSEALSSIEAPVDPVDPVDPVVDPAE